MKWLERCRIKPYAHQITGIEKIVTHPYFLLADEMGVGKTMQAIIAAQLLYAANKIDRVLVVTPATVRGVWFHEEFGELAKFLWEDIAHVVTEFHTRERSWIFGQSPHKPMLWMITNYDFVRSATRTRQLQEFCNNRTMLILDESSKVKNHRAKQTKAIKQLRWSCARVLMLNGTPLANSPRDMYSQGNILHPKILETPYVYQFNARYAIRGGDGDREWDVGWRNLEDMQERFKPYTLRRLKTDCLDLPPKLPPVTLTATLSAEEWRVYKAMKEELIAWLDDPRSHSIAGQAIVKAMRLSQITAGFLGGLITPDPSMLDDKPDWMPFASGPTNETTEIDWDEIEQSQKLTVREVGRSKLDLFLEWFGDQLERDPNFKLLGWCKFRPELSRVHSALRSHYPHVESLMLHGAQKRAEREAALQLLDARTAPTGPAVLMGMPDAGAMGHTFVAAHTVIYLTDTDSLLNYLQSQDRVHRPGQTHPVSYFHILAEGPRGEKTIDHIRFKALKAKENLATWTTSAWRQALEE